MVKINEFNATVTSAAAGLIGVLKALIVLFVFANILYSTGLDPVTGIVNLVNTFLGGGLSGLLALMFLVSLMDK